MKVVLVVEEEREERKLENGYGLQVENIGILFCMSCPRERELCC